MTVPQQKFREIVFQMLYSYDIGKANEEDMIELLMKELAVTRKVVQKARDRVEEIVSILIELDQMISQASLSYDFERIQSVERNVLRLGLFELFFDEQIPPKVAISEAMRLARKFGSPESAGFVNAIMDTLYQASMGKDVNENKIAESVNRMIKSEEISKEASENNKSKSEPKNE